MATAFPSGFAQRGDPSDAPTVAVAIPPPPGFGSRRRFARQRTPQSRFERPIVRVVAQPSPFVVRGPTPPPIPVTAAGAPVYMGEWINLTTGQSLAHVHVMGELLMHEYADVRVDSKRLGCAVLTLLAAKPPPMTDPDRIKVNLRLCSSDFNDVGTLWLGLPLGILESEDMFNVRYRSCGKTATLHVVKCICYMDN